MKLRACRKVFARDPEAYLVWALGPEMRETPSPYSKRTLRRAGRRWGTHMRRQIRRLAAGQPPIRFSARNFQPPIAARAW